jgi:hypothetical protein
MLSEFSVGTGDRKWQSHAACLSGERRHRADVLPVAQGVRRAEARAGQTAQGTREGELEAQATGGGAVAGEADPAGRGAAFDVAAGARLIRVILAKYRA